MAEAETRTTVAPGAGPAPVLPGAEPYSAPGGPHASSTQDHIVPPVSADVLAERVSGPVERVNLERSHHLGTLDYDRDIVLQRAVSFALRVSAGLAP